MRVNLILKGLTSPLTRENFEKPCPASVVALTHTLLPLPPDLSHIRGIRKPSAAREL